MSIIIFQHSDSGGPGRLGATLRDNGFRLDIRRPDRFGTDRQQGVPPDLDNIHGLVILGGPQMVTDVEKTPWLAAEAALLKQAHEARLPIIGICLGAQLIAQTLGGKVDWKEKPSIGMAPLSINTTGQTEIILAGLTWTHPQFFSCSQEVKQLPPGATALASAPGTANAAFKIGLRTFAFQFHFECDRPMLDSISAESCGGGNAERACVTPGDLAAQFDRDYAAFARMGDRLSLNIAAYCFPIARRMSA